MRPQVAPIAAPSGPAYGKSPGRPGPSSVCVAFQPTSGFPRRLCLPALPAGRSSGRPEFRPSGVAANASPGFPGSCVYGWSMINPAKPEPCILRRSRGMNLRVQSGVTNPTGLGCLPDLGSSLRLPDKPTCEVALRNRTCIVLPESNCFPNSLQVHQLKRA